MEYKKPERDVIKAWRLRRAIGTAILAVSFAAGVAAAALSGWGTVQLCIAVGIGVILVYAAVGMAVYPLIEYRQWRYMISDERIEIVHGIFFIKRDVIPVVRIQNITVKQGPIYRRYGLYTVERGDCRGYFPQHT